MNTAELIYKTIQFIFSNIWIYTGFLLIILTIRGDLTRTIRGFKEFIKKSISRYEEKKKQIEGFKSYKKQ